MARKPTKSKRFKYNLQTLLNVREIRETQAKDAFNAAELQLIEEKKKEVVAREREELAYQDYREFMHTGDIGNPHEIQRHKLFCDKRSDELKRQVQAVEDAKRAVDNARDKMVQAMKDKKIMEKDKENKRDAWKKLMDKEASKFLDDIATIKFSKKKDA